MNCETQHRNHRWLANGPGVGVWLAGLVVLMFVAAGCARSKSAISHQPTAALDSRLSTLDQSSPSADRSQAAAVIAPPAPVPTRTWRFLKPPGHKIVWWETSTNLNHWTFEGWTTNDTITIALTNAMQFYRFASVPWSNSLRIGVGKIQPPDFFQP